MTRGKDLFDYFFRWLRKRSISTRDLIEANITDVTPQVEVIGTT